MSFPERKLNMKVYLVPISCFCSVAKSCPVLCDSVDCNTPVLLVPHCLPEFAQNIVRWAGDAIQPSHPLPTFSLFAFNLSQHQGLFHESALPIRYRNIGASGSVLPMNSRGWFPLGLTGLISLLSQELSRFFSSTTIREYWFFGPQPSLSPTVTSVDDYWKNCSFDCTDFGWQSDVSAF